MTHEKNIGNAIKQIVGTTLEYIVTLQVAGPILYELVNGSYYGICGYPITLNDSDNVALGIALSSTIPSLIREELRDDKKVYFEFEDTAAAALIGPVSSIATLASRAVGYYLGAGARYIIK